MRAAVNTRYGAPEVVRITDVPAPTPTRDELLVRVHATTVNRTDCGYRAAKPFFIRPFSGLVRPRTRVLGNQFAGEVEEVGDGVTSFAVGDRVFGYVEGRFGAHAEYMTVPEHAWVATIPAGLTYQAAAASTEGSHYALAFIRAARIGGGQDVLVNGATGGIGSAAVQLIKSLGAGVTAVCGGEHVALVEGLGAAHGLHRRGLHGGRAAVRRGPRRGRQELVRAMQAAVEAGRDLPLLRSRSALAEPVPRADHAGVPRQEGHVPIPRHDQQIVGYIKELLESGAFRPVVDRVYRLDQIVEAYT